MKILKKYWKILAGLALIGILAAAYAWFFVYNKAHPDYEHIEAEHHFKSAVLFNAFQDGPNETNEKCTGKVISISGTFDYIETSPEQTILVFVFDQGMFGDEGIRCSLLDNYKEVATKLEPGTKVEVKGYCTGYNDTDVILEKCTLKTI